MRKKECHGQAGCGNNIFLIFILYEINQLKDKVDTILLKTNITTLKKAASSLISKRRIV